MPAPAFADLGQSLLDLLFPPRCVSCGARGALLCTACLGTMHPPAPPLCPRCGRSLAGLPSCPTCAAGRSPVALDSVRVATVYAGPMRKAIHALKYEDQRRLATPLGDLLAAVLAELGQPVDALVPVPLHTTRRRDRGFNQAELLARRCARRLDIACLPGALVRTRATPPQVGLSLAERQRNVAGAFALASPSLAAGLAGKRLAIVDDVTTTGSTLEAAATALRAASPASILGLALARPDLADDQHISTPAATGKRAQGVARGSRP
jgi:ComF family protein